MGVVIVGASLAGVRTVQALRRRGYADSITLVDGEAQPACDRPPLSKSHLADPASEPRALITAAQLADLDVTTMLGRYATDLDPVTKTIGLAGERLSYTTLVIATGSAPRMLPGLEPATGVHVLRTAEHAGEIRAALAAGARTVIVGGGFIGAEVAWTALGMGCEVTIVEPLPALMIRGLGPVLGEVFSRRHAAAGVRLRLGVGVSAVGGGVVRLSDGDALPADLVVVGIGAVPQTAWLRGSGLDLDNGVRCDEHLAAVGVADVYAAGDVARWHHPRYGEPVRLEHWTNAAEHAPVVAANICGEPTVYDAVPYVWSEQLGSRLQVFGRIRPQDPVRFVHGGPDSPSFVAVAGGPDGLQGVVGFGAVRELMPFRKLLVAGASWAEALDLAGASA